MDESFGCAFFAAIAVAMVAITIAYDVFAAG